MKVLKCVCLIGSATVWLSCSTVSSDVRSSSRIGTAGVPYGGSTRADDADSVALIGAGDIANCDSDGHERTAALVDSLLKRATVPTWILAVGDLVYGRGTGGSFAECYGPSWGRFGRITRPVPGNHEYKTGFLWFLFGGNASPYFKYFNAFSDQAGAADEGWYYYQHGSWGVYALNSAKGRIRPKSKQWEWLNASLERRSEGCSIAYMHHPRFSAGKHKDSKDMADVWQLLADRGVDILIAGHDHNYQSFEPQTVDGEPSPNGIRAFIVGTGGGTLRPATFPTAGVLRRSTSEHFGVLKLILHRDSYDWQFITTDGLVWDSGSSSCQNTRPAGF